MTTNRDKCDSLERQPVEANIVWRATSDSVFASPPEFGQDRVYYLADDGRRSASLLCAWRDGDDPRYLMFAMDHHDCEDLIVDDRPSLIPPDADRFFKLKLQQVGFDLQAAYWRTQPLSEPVRLHHSTFAICYELGAPDELQTLRCWDAELRIRALERKRGTKIVVLTQLIIDDMDALGRYYYEIDE